MTMRMLPLLACLTAISLLAAPAAPAHAHGDGKCAQHAYDPNHPAFRDIVSEKSLGNQHVDRPVDYGTEFPTSGPHSPTPAKPGFYDKPVAPEQLVHSLEHGNIVIYYDKPGEAALTQLHKWTEQFLDAWDGVIAVPHGGLGEGVVLTAWQHRLALPKIDTRAAFFIDAFRGRGPENCIR